MAADEAVLLDRGLELAQPVHDVRRIDPGQAAEPVGAPGNQLGDVFVRHVGRAAHPEIARALGDQERPLDARAVHHLDIVLDRHAVAVFGPDPDLLAEIPVGRHPPLVERLGREGIADDVDGSIVLSGNPGHDGVSDPAGVARLKHYHKALVRP